MGSKGHICIGGARDAGKLKVRIVLQAPSDGAIDPAACVGLCGALAFVRHMVSGGVAVDRGHKQSNGLSEVAIWISPPPLGSSDDGQAAMSPHPGAQINGESAGQVPSTQNEAANRRSLDMCTSIFTTQSANSQCESVPTSVQDQPTNSESIILFQPVIVDLVDRAFLDVCSAVVTVLNADLTHQARTDDAVYQVCLKLPAKT